MKWQDSWLLKWIDVTSIADNFDFIFTHKCVVLCNDATGTLKGFCAFDDKNFNAHFLERLQIRVQKPEFKEHQFSLVLPESLKNRFKLLHPESSTFKLETITSSFVKINKRAGACRVRTKIRVVNVDDSPVMLKMLKNIFQSLEYFEVVGQVNDSKTAAQKIKTLIPDIITLDIQMPHKNGVEVLQEILSDSYYPVIMVSSVSLEEGSLAFEALNAGAFDYIHKPRLEDKEEFKQLLGEKILGALEGKNVRHVIKKHTAPKAASSVLQQKTYPDNFFWCLGASTGGTQALTSVFTSLPASIPPTLVVQHIPPVYSKAFADYVDQLCPFKVKEAAHDEEVLANHVYIAPGGLQMGIKKKQNRYYIYLEDSERVNRFKPSVDYLFKSIAATPGLTLVAGILTGMGKDGALGLLELKKVGASTFAQNEESSAVFGMPRAAIEVGATKNIVALENIAQTLLAMSSPSLRKTA